VLAIAFPASYPMPRRASLDLKASHRSSNAREAGDVEAPSTAPRSLPSAVAIKTQAVHIETFKPGRATDQQRHHQSAIIVSASLPSGSDRMPCGLRIRAQRNPKTSAPITCPRRANAPYLSINDRRITLAAMIETVLSQSRSRHYPPTAEAHMQILLREDLEHHREPR